MFSGVCSRRSINSVAPLTAASGSTAAPTQPHQQVAADHAAGETTRAHAQNDEVFVAEQPELEGAPPQHDKRSVEQHEPEVVQTVSVADCENVSAEAMDNMQQFWEQDGEQHEQDEVAPAADTEDSYLLQQQQQYMELQELQASYKAAEQQQQQKKTIAQQAKAAAAQHTAQHRQPQLQQQVQHSVEQQQYSAAASSTVVQLQQELMQQAKLREVRTVKGSCSCLDTASIPAVSHLPQCIFQLFVSIFIHNYALHSCAA
jgi:hypothetical protein